MELPASDDVEEVGVVLSGGNMTLTLTLTLDWTTSNIDLSAFFDLLAGEPRVNAHCMHALTLTALHVHASVR